jgi:CelD/BcsL family acetyltransferase involved in cellulose biosynthesis
LNATHALQPEWSDLWNRCPDATPFASPEWLIPWHDHLFQGGDVEMLTARRDGRLIGLAPLFIHGTAGQPRTLSFLGSGVTDYLGFLLDPNHTVDALQTIRRQIEKLPWDICDLQEIPPGSPLLIEGAEQSVSETCAVVSLPPSMSEFEAALTPKFRHNLRNARNRLLDLGVSFETAEPDQDAEYAEALFELHRHRWEKRDHSGMLATPQLQYFFRAIVKGFRNRGWLRFHGLRRNGRLSAVMCVFNARRRAYYYLGGFDDSLQRFSPGTALTRHAIENAIAERTLEFDFLRQREPYKYRWGAADRPNSRLRIKRSPELSALEPVETALAIGNVTEET